MYSPTGIPSGSTNITLTPGFYPGSPYPENWVVWIDTNKDHVFSDGERIYSGKSSSAISAQVNIPYFTGEAIMRVAMQWNNSAPNACGHVRWGAVEDYLVKIQ